MRDAEGARENRRALGARILTVVALLLLALLSIEYFVVSSRIAAERPLWMDEVLATWTARLPSASAIWNALVKGSDFSPPLYPLLLHALIQFGNHNYLALRMPSIIAVFIVGVAAFVQVRRRHPLPVAALAMVLCLEGGLYSFALQARPYACVTACFALALVLWDIPADRKPSPWSATAMLLLLVAAVGMHFYAVLLAAAVGLMELVWTTVHRRIRWLHIVVPAIACLSILLWLPIMQHTLAFNRGDTAAVDYYARPLPTRLAAAYGWCLIGHRMLWVSPFTLLLAVWTANAILAIRSGTTLPRRRETSNLAIIAGVTLAIPLLVYLVTLVAVHTFNLRYVIAGSLGFSILIACRTARLPGPQALCCLVLIASAWTMASTDTGAADAKQRARVLALVRRAPPDLPIVTGNGLRFFEIREGAGPTIAHRLVFLKPPAGIPDPDPTNAHQVERWGTILPRLVVTSTATFVRSQSRFLVFSDASATDILPSWLVRHGYTLDVLLRTGDAWLAEVRTARAPLPAASDHAPLTPAAANRLK